MSFDRAVEVAGVVMTEMRDWFLSARFLSGLLLGILFLYLASRRLRHGSSLTFNLPFSLGSATINASQIDRVAAWKLYIQLKTRKAAVPFDRENDVVIEVYDSLYLLFDSTRTLLLELPPAEYAKDDGLASLMLRVQNDGVRPHLTRWQADFRRWWTVALSAPENGQRSPQEIQRDYPRYGDLLADLQRTNTELSKFADELLVVARGGRPRKRRVIAAPIRPTPADGIGDPGETDLPPPPAAPAVGQDGPAGEASPPPKIQEHD